MEEPVRRKSGSFMSFGIQGKVALLVIVATAASALLVAKVLTDRAAEVLREHELVDLGDEASLRGWVIIDEIDGLRDDLINIAFSPEFQGGVEGERTPEELKSLARALCRRNWANQTISGSPVPMHLLGRACIFHRSSACASPAPTSPAIRSSAGSP